MAVHKGCLCAGWPPNALDHLESPLGVAMFWIHRRLGTNGRFKTCCLAACSLCCWAHPIRVLIARGCLVCSFLGKQRAGAVVSSARRSSCHGHFWRGGTAQRLQDVGRRPSAMRSGVARNRAQHSSWLEVQALQGRQRCQRPGRER